MGGVVGERAERLELLLVFEALPGAHFLERAPAHEHHADGAVAERAEEELVRSVAHQRRVAHFARKFADHSVHVACLRLLVVAALRAAQRELVGLAAPLRNHQQPATLQHQHRHQLVPLPEVALRNDEVVSRQHSAHYSLLSTGLQV